MYVVFYGDDRGLVRDEASTFINKNLKPEQSLNTIEAHLYQPGLINDAVGASSLFGGEEWYLLDEPSSNQDFLDETITSLEAMQESENNFVVIESKLLAPLKKKYAKYADDVKEFSLEKRAKSNPFLLAEALAAKDKKRLWVLLQEARMRGSSEEEVIGILWWQLKTLRLASQTSSANEAGLKDFPFNKAKGALVKFAPGEIEKLSQSLLEVYHEGHGGIREIDLALERWVLGV